MLQDILTKITKKRLEKNLSQYYMAAQLNISQGHYNKLENGKKTLSFERAVEIADLLGLNIELVEHHQPKTHNSQLITHNS